MKVTSPAAAARAALTTSRPHASAREGFHADSQAAHLQMFSHSQHMQADIQQRRHRCLQRGREGWKEGGPDEVLTHAQTQTEVCDGVGFITAEWLMQKPQQQRCFWKYIYFSSAFE